MKKKPVRVSFVECPCPNRVEFGMFKLCSNCGFLFRDLPKRVKKSVPGS